MKVGILTFHRAINYGAVMQAYALAKKLSERFKEDSFEIIDYNCIERELFVLKCPIVFLYRRSLLQGYQKIIQTREFKKAIRQLKLSKKMVCVSRESLGRYISNNYDTVIVGSDAVFNWSDIGLPNAYFLSGIHVKNKMAYAASAYLQNYNTVTDIQKRIIKSSLCDFKYIGVRDQSTFNFVCNYVEDKSIVEHNCDPSIFLDMDFDEFDLLKKLRKHNFDFNKKTVFVMLMNENYGAFVRKYYGENVQIVALMDGNRNADIYLYDLSPFEWAHVFRFGSFLITDYFHGTIFGLKNNIPVLSIDSSGYTDASVGYESKAKDLLCTRLNLPFIYVNKNELSGDLGYSVFSDCMAAIEKKFCVKELEERMSREASSFEKFAKAYSKIRSKENHTDE